jgi:hypothetical protein
MRQKVVLGLKSLDAVSVENLVGSGTPDVNHTHGWIELKVIPNFPRGGIVKVHHFKPEQRAWALRRARAHGRVHMLLLVKEEWFLYDGTEAAINLGLNWGEQDCREQALGYWKRTINWDEFRDIITA